MDSKKTDIREHQEAVDELALSSNRQKGELGRVLLEKEDLNEKSIDGPLQDALESQKELEELEEKRDELKSALDGKIETSDRLAELENERQEYQKTKNSLQIEIGRKGWDLYQHGALEENEFAAFFSEVIERSREIEEFDRQARDLESEREQSGIVKKVTLAAKIGITRNRVGRLENSLEELFGRAGEALISSGKVEDIPDEEMRRYTSRLKDIEENADEREKENDTLKKRIDRYEKEIEELSENISPEKKLKSYEAEIARVEENHVDRLEKLGDLYFSRPELHDRDDTTVRTILERIDDLESQKRSHQDSIHVLQSQIEKNELEEEIKKKEESISKLEKKVQAQKEEIKSLREEIGNEKNRLSELDKIVSGRAGETSEDEGDGKSSG